MQHTIDEDARRHHCFRIQGAQRRHVLRLHDGELGGHSHDRVEVARAAPKGEIAPAVGLPGLDECDIAGQRFFQHVVTAVDGAGFLATGQQGAGGRRGEEGGDAGAGGAHAFSQRSLRHNLKLDPAVFIQRLEDDGAGGAGKAADHLADAAEFHQAGKAGVAGAGVVGDAHEILGALRDQAVEHCVRLANGAEAADEDGRAVLDAVQGFGHGTDGLVDHGFARAAGCACKSAAEASGRRSITASTA